MGTLLFIKKVMGVGFELLIKKAMDNGSEFHYSLKFILIITH